MTKWRKNSGKKCEMNFLKVMETIGNAQIIDWSWKMTEESLDENWLLCHVPFGKSHGRQKWVSNRFDQMHYFTRWILIQVVTCVKRRTVKSLWCLHLSASDIFAEKGLYRFFLAKEGTNTMWKWSDHSKCTETNCVRSIFLPWTPHKKTQHRFFEKDRKTRLSSSRAHDGKWKM